MEDGPLLSSPDEYHCSPDGHLRSPDEIAEDMNTQLNARKRSAAQEDYDNTEGEEFKVTRTLAAQSCFKCLSSC
jgi:hypothetical protein